MHRESKFLFKFFDKAFVIRLLLWVHLLSLIILADGYVLLQVAARYGDYAALAITLSTGLVGILIIINTLRSIIDVLHDMVSQGRSPNVEYGTVIVLTVAGILILIPGLVSDAIGLLCYLPPMRLICRRIVTRLLGNQLEQLYEYLRLSE